VDEVNLWCSRYRIWARCCIAITLICSKSEIYSMKTHGKTYCLEIGGSLEICKLVRRRVRVWPGLHAGPRLHVRYVRI
jgi:hypothetical protein